MQIDIHKQWDTFKNTINTSEMEYVKLDWALNTPMCIDMLHGPICNLSHPMVNFFLVYVITQDVGFSASHCVLFSSGICQCVPFSSSIHSLTLFIAMASKWKVQIIPR